MIPKKPRLCKRLFIFFLVAGWGGAYPPTLYAHDDQAVLSAFKKAQQGVVGIYSFNEQAGKNWGEISGLGSGFFYSEKCYVVTNHHVIEGAKRVGISISGEDRGREAKVLAASKRLDIALLKVQGQYRCQPLASSQVDDISVGQSVFALGHPIGLDVTITGGMVSALNRSFSHSEETYHRLVQTDVPIFPGNSGGPIIDRDGRVVGVNTFKTKFGTGLSFAVPMSVVHRLMPELLSNGELKPRTLGIQAEQHEKKVIRKIDDYVSGVFVKEVFANSPAQRAGIQAKDLIFKSNGKPLKSINDLEMELYSYPLGEKINLELARGESLVEVTIQVSTQ